MSRSKEGREQITQPTESRSTERTLDNRLGARGQTDYTPGRESYRDFPRRSTSLRGREESYLQSRDASGERYRTGRGEPEIGRRAETTPRYGSHRDVPHGRHAGRYERERRYGRTPYNELTGRSNRYREDERDYGYRYDRETYSDPYNRESFSGQFGSYERDEGPSLANMGWGTGRGIDYDRDYRERDRERSRLRCGDIMTKDVTTCTAQSNIREVADKMEDENVGSIPVVENGRLIGIVTDRDIVCRVVAEGKDTGTIPVTEAMSQDLVTCMPDDTVHEAIRKMAEHQIRRLPIVDFNGRLRGIIAMADIALEAERDRDLAMALEQISQPTPNRSRRM
jgi:CBS domain-containing protein